MSRHREGHGPLVRHARAGRRDVVRRQELLRVRGHSVAWVPPLLLLVAIAVADYHTIGEFRMISWIVLVPALAASICGVWGTALFAVLSLVTYVVADSAWPHEYRAGRADFVLVALGGILATLACAIRVRDENRALHMSDVADTVRRTVLRPLPPGWGGLDHAGVYLTAEAHARGGGAIDVKQPRPPRPPGLVGGGEGPGRGRGPPGGGADHPGGLTLPAAAPAGGGGDFYDIQPGPHGTRVLVGDVQGKGLGAVEAAAALLGTFREAAYHEADLVTVAERLETRMIRHRGHTVALGRSDGDRFATAVLLSFPDDEAEAVDVLLFGHEPPLAVGPGGVRTLSAGAGLPLGCQDLAPGPPRSRRWRVAADETLLLVTDGVTEARDGTGAFYPLAHEVSRAVDEDPGTAEPARLAAFVRDGTLRHCGGRLGDDTTVFAVRRRPGGEAPEGGRLRS
ncbi:PP2C family protein-serine/threonine phosphatase [Streptomyces massasporeus]|uniref:PP2C family protein-serine/threonine phosphatase n=1 Tax=Streptomyces massasporeus TaxID=67324 RepID=UPI0036854395